MIELSIEEHDAINMADESKSLLYLSRHPLRFLVQRRGPLKVIPFLIITVILLVLIGVCERVAKSNTNLSGGTSVLYVKLELATNSRRTLEILNSLNTKGTFALGISNGLHMALAWFFAADLMLLSLLVAYKLQHEKRTHISQNRVFTKFNKVVSAIGYTLAWFLFFPSLLYGIAQMLIMAQMLFGVTQALSVVTFVFVITFLTIGVVVPLVYIVLGGLYVIILLILARKYGYYWYKRQSV